MSLLNEFGADLRFSSGDAFRSLHAWLILVLMASYVPSMLVAPWIMNDWSWESVQGVWRSWQPLNVGVLALLSSMVALQATRHTERLRRQDKLLAARAFLPSALSLICGYADQCARLLEQAHDFVEARKSKTGGLAPFSGDIPPLPKEIAEPFANAIEVGGRDVALHLADILKRLQILNARLSSMIDGLQGRSHLIITSANVVGSIVDLGFLHASVSRVFPYGRLTSDLNVAPLAKEELINSYNILSHRFADIDGVSERTKFELENGNPSNPGSM